MSVKEFFEYNRQNEISEAAFAYTKSDVVPAETVNISFGDFINGAEWADKHPSKNLLSRFVTLTIQWMKSQEYQEYGGGPFERLIPDERIDDYIENITKIKFDDDGEWISGR